MTEIHIPSRLLSVFRSAERVMVSTGAGISTESGIPAFRGAGGLWEEFKPEELATPAAFARDPAKVWKWYDWRRQMLKNVQPNAGHYALAEMETLVPRFFLFTQNIDGLHQKAGSKRVYELHGNIWAVRCMREGKKFQLSENPLPELPPKCETCGANLRPDVVWFGEALPEDIIDIAYKVAANCDIFFLIGSSATVQPAASLAWIAHANGAFVVDINPEATAAEEIANQTFREKSGVVLPQIINALKLQTDA